MPTDRPTDRQTTSLPIQTTTSKMASEIAEIMATESQNDEYADTVGVSFVLLCGRV
jgi:hypothetical protein